MISLAVLLASALVPTIACQVLHANYLRNMPRDPDVRARRIDAFRRSTLFGGAAMVTAAAVVGALTADAAITPRWPLAGAWFFSTLCMVTAWVALALGQRTPEEAEAMSSIETAGRTVQTAILWFTAVGISSVAMGLLRPVLPWPPLVSALASALVSVAAAIVLSPWLLMLAAVWPVYPTRVSFGGASWRLAHLPAPHPFLTHVAAIPWLRTVLVTDGIIKRMPERFWRTLVAYEVAERVGSKLERAQRWLVAVPLAAVVFVAADAAAGGDPRKLVAGTTLAAGFTFVAAWAANRQWDTNLSMDRSDPSPQELAQTLRHLPPSHGQAMPRTSHQPLGAALYDRLFALGHDPGPRRR